MQEFIVLHKYSTSSTYCAHNYVNIISGSIVMISVNDEFSIAKENS